MQTILLDCWTQTVLCPTHVLSILSYHSKIISLLWRAFTLWDILASHLIVNNQVRSLCHFVGPFFVNPSRRITDSLLPHALYLDQTSAIWAWNPVSVPSKLTYTQDQGNLGLILLNTIAKAIVLHFCSVRRSNIIICSLSELLQIFGIFIIMRASLGSGVVCPNFEVPGAEDFVEPIWALLYLSCAAVICAVLVLVPKK